jgi:RNA polymerase sigma-70 factor, ECF subfamily
LLNFDRLLLLEGRNMPHNDSSWEMAIERFHEPLLREAQKRMGRGTSCSEDVSDLVQGTLLKALAKQDQFRGTTDAELWGWLKAILDRLAIDMRRGSRKEEAPGVQPRSHRADDSSPAASAEPVLDESSPSQKCSKSEQLALMLSELQNLPAEQGTAVRLFHLEGLEVHEIASRMDKTKAAVASLLFRGRKALRERMEGGSTDDKL